jgi:hypothetical protein
VYDDLVPEQARQGVRDGFGCFARERKNVIRCAGKLLRFRRPVYRDQSIDYLIRQVVTAADPDILLFVD